MCRLFILGNGGEMLLLGAMPALAEACSTASWLAVQASIRLRGEFRLSGGGCGFEASDITFPHVCLAFGLSARKAQLGMRS